MKVWLTSVFRVFESLLCIVKLNIKRINPDVIFYYPKHFNRGKGGVNEFLKPLIDSCDKNNISYLIFEEPAKNGLRNKKAIPFDLVFYLILIFRKFLMLNKYDHFEAREWKISKMIKATFFSNMNPKVVITMSNSMLGFFRGWNDTMPLYDYQHGIIYSWHPGYMIDDCGAKHIVVNRSKLMLFGEGFKRLLTKGNDKYFSENSICIGTNVKYQMLYREFNHSILLSLPITTADEIEPVQSVLLEELKAMFQENQSFYIENKIVFYLKHHPRYDGVLDISRILNFSFVKIINKSLLDCFFNCSLHLTYNSTTTFEAATLGIPTLFLKGFGDDPLFEKEFKYPNYQVFLNIQENIKEFVREPSMYRSAVALAKDWVKAYYEPFNENEFVKLINEKN